MALGKCEPSRCSCPISARSRTGRTELASRWLRQHAATEHRKEPSVFPCKQPGCGATPAAVRRAGRNSLPPGKRRAVRSIEEQDVTLHVRDATGRVFGEQGNQLGSEYSARADFAGHHAEMTGPVRNREHRAQRQHDVAPADGGLGGSHEVDAGRHVQVSEDGCAVEERSVHGLNSNRCSNVLWCARPG